MKWWRIKYSEMQVSRHMDRIQFIVSASISFLAILFIIMRLIWPKLLLDQITVFFLVIATIPWLTLFIQKFKGWGVELEAKTSQGKTANPPGLDIKPLQPIVEIEQAEISAVRQRKFLLLYGGIKSKVLKMTILNDGHFASTRML